MVVDQGSQDSQLSSTSGLPQSLAPRERQETVAWCPMRNASPSKGQLRQEIGILNSRVAGVEQEANAYYTRQRAEFRTAAETYAAEARENYADSWRTQADTAGHSG